MPRVGTDYQRVHDWTDDAESEVPFSAERFDEEHDDIAGALTESATYSYVDASRTFTADVAGARARLLTARANDALSLLDFGAVGDGSNYALSAVYSTLGAAQAVYPFVTSLTQNLNWAAMQAAANSGRPITIPDGRFYIPNHDTIALPAGADIVFKGAGRRSSVIVFDDSAGTDRNDLFRAESSAPVRSLYLADFGIESDWGVGNFTTRSHFMEINVADESIIENCRFYGCRHMSTVIVGALKSIDIGCEYDTGRKDGCRRIDCRSTIVSDCDFIRMCDDSIAIHTTDVKAAPLVSSASVVGNRITDGLGIAILGPKMVVVADNVLTRPYTRAIQVGDDVDGTTEGNAPVLSVTITGNVITDVFDGFLVTGDGGSSRKWIYTAVTPPTTNGSGYVGQGNGAGGIVAPWAYFYANNTDDAGTAMGQWGLTIANNVCMRTLKPTANYSDYGFGQRLGPNGWVNPAITADMIGGSQIMILNHAWYANITGNALWGGDNGIYLDGTPSSAYLSWRDVLISNNTITNFSDTGVLFEGEGSIAIDGNLIDGDPLHTHSQRGSGGTWMTILPDHFAFRNNGGVTARVTNNSVRNCGRFAGGSASDFYDGNTLYCNPVLLGGSTSNVGIAYIDAACRFGTVQIEDGDPASVTYGKRLNICPTTSMAMPTSGKFVEGHIVWAVQPSVSGASVLGWRRLTTGTGHVVGTDWQPIIYSDSGLGEFDVMSTVPDDQEAAIRNYTSTADQTANIQAAIDTADAAGGGIVRFPDGKFTLAGTLSLAGKKNVHLVGCGGINADYAADNGTVLLYTGAAGTSGAINGQNSKGCSVTHMSIAYSSVAFDGYLLDFSTPLGTFGTWHKTEIGHCSFFHTAQLTPARALINVSNVIDAHVHNCKFAHGQFAIMGAATGVATQTATGTSISWPNHRIDATAGLNKAVTFQALSGGTLPTGIAANTTYYIKTIPDANTITVSATVGGAAISTSATGSGTWLASLVSTDTISHRIEHNDFIAISQFAIVNPSYTCQIRENNFESTPAPYKPSGILVVGANVSHGVSICGNNFTDVTTAGNFWIDLGISYATVIERNTMTGDINATGVLVKAIRFRSFVEGGSVSRNFFIYFDRSIEFNASTFGLGVNNNFFNLPINTQVVNTTYCDKSCDLTGNYPDVSPTLTATPATGFVQAFDPATGLWSHLPISKLIAGPFTRYTDAKSITAQTTSGAAAAVVETPAAKIMLDVLDFDATTAEYASFTLRCPDGYSPSTLKFQAHWTHTTGGSPYGVVWGMSARASADGQYMDTAYTTTTLSSDTGGVAYTHYCSPLSAAHAVEGTPLTQCELHIRIARMPTDGNDTLAADARLLGVTLHFDPA